MSNIYLWALEVNDEYWQKDESFAKAISKVSTEFFNQLCTVYDPFRYYDQKFIKRDYKAFMAGQYKRYKEFVKNHKTK